MSEGGYQGGFGGGKSHRDKIGDARKHRKMLKKENEMGRARGLMMKRNALVGGSLRRRIKGSPRFGWRFGPKTHFFVSASSYLLFLLPWSALFCIPLQYFYSFQIILKASALLVLSRLFITCLALMFLIS